jgi:threonine dehydrogenase-like Zn-dependent dehydrogenase
VRAITFDASIARYLATRVAGRIGPNLLTGAGRCTRVAEVPDPTLPGDRWVRIRTLLGGICGSDLGLVRLDVSPSTSPFSSSPFVIGHENVGVVAEVGSAVRRLRPGDRVVADPLLPCAVRAISPACRGCAEGHPSRCERFTDGAIAPGMLLGTTRGLGGSWGSAYVAHEDQVVCVPAGVSDSAAVLLEPFTCLLSPLLAHPPEPGARVLVIGAGAIGLMAVAALTAVEPAARLTVLARHAFQGEFAERLGAARIVRARRAEAGFAEALAQESGGRLLQPILGPKIMTGGFDLSVVCAGNDEAVDAALRFTRAGGTILLVANVVRLRSLDWTPVWMKQLAVRGSVCSDRHEIDGDRRSTFEIGMEMLDRGLAAKLEPLVTHAFPIARYREALAVAFGRPGTPHVKVVFEHAETGA